MVSRRNFGRLATPDLLLLNTEALYIDSDGRMRLRIASASLTQSANGLALAQDVRTTASPTFAGLTLDNLSGFLKATAGVVSVGTQTLDTQLTTTGNAAATETTLFTTSLPANTFAAVGESVEITAGGSFGNTASADKQIFARVDGFSVFLSGNQTVQNKQWWLRLLITRVDSSNAKCITSVTTSSGVYFADAAYANKSTLTFSSTIPVSIVGIGTNANDVVGEVWKVVKVA